MGSGSDTAEVVTKYYHALGRLIAFRKNGTLFWVGTDHLGSTIWVADAGFNPLSGENGQRRYTPYGVNRDPGSSLNTDHAFTSQIEDESIGLYWCASRAYDPALGRFTCPDTVVPSPGNPRCLNRYQYCGNNPLKMVDPSGHVAFNHALGGFVDDEGNIVPQGEGGDGGDPPLDSGPPAPPEPDPDPQQFAEPLEVDVSPAAETSAGDASVSTDPPPPPSPGVQVGPSMYYMGPATVSADASAASGASPLPSEGDVVSGAINGAMEGLQRMIPQLALYCESEIVEEGWEVPHIRSRIPFPDALNIQNCVKSVRMGGLLNMGQEIISDFGNPDLRVEQKVERALVAGLVGAGTTVVAAAVVGTTAHLWAAVGMTAGVGVLGSWAQNSFIIPGIERGLGWQ